MKITFIVGLPGSGKTYLGNEMVLADDEITLLDDITVFGGLDELQECVSHGFEHIVVTDVFLCRERDRQLALKWLSKNASAYALEWLYFENAPEKCLANVRRRNGMGDERKVEGFIRDLTRHYVIPAGVVVKEVFSQE